MALQSPLAQIDCRKKGRGAVAVIDNRLDNTVGGGLKPCTPRCLSRTPLAHTPAASPPSWAHPHPSERTRPPPRCSAFTMLAKSAAELSVTNSCSARLHACKPSFSNQQRPSPQSSSKCQAMCGTWQASLLNGSPSHLVMVAPAATNPKTRMGVKPQSKQYIHPVRSKLVVAGQPAGRRPESHLRARFASSPKSSGARTRL
jgi:hypothetical protein